MALYSSTISRLRSTSRTGQSTISDESLAKQQSPHIVSIHILDDDSLLNVFYFYRPLFLGEDEKDLNRLLGGMPWSRGRWWYRLAHVCQRWRNRIFGSASYLRLSLVCTNGTPVENMLTHSPPLPLTVDYIGEDGITAEDEEGILLALEQRHRVRHLRLVFPVQNLHMLAMAIDEEFPILEHLIMYPPLNDNTPLKPRETLQAPNLRHLSLRGFACPIRPRLHPTAAGLVTLCLTIIHPSAYFQPKILLQWISFMPQLESLEIAFQFPVRNRDLERQLTRTPTTTHITLPNLRLFWFRGVRAYLEAVVCRITTPRLENLRIRLFKQLTFPIPRLRQFMNTTENLRFDNAVIMFKDKEIDALISFRGADTHVFGVTVDCWHLDWQVSSVAQISNALTQVLSAVENLTFEHETHSQSSEEHNDVDRIEWRNLLRSFSIVKILHVKDGLVEKLSHCLRLEDGEDPLELLPELGVLTYSGSHNSDDAFTSFIDARQKAGRPVTLDNRTMYGMSSSGPFTSKWPAAPQEFDLSSQHSWYPQMPHSQPYFGDTGKRRALIIGINYSLHPVPGFELKLCTEDAYGMANFLRDNLGFEHDDIRIITDENPWDHPTVDNIMEAMAALVYDAQPNDSLVFYYSGHALQVKDMSGRELNGLAECICAKEYQGFPYLNSDTPGLISDDTMHQLMVKPLPRNCRLTAIFDSCHSGGLLGLPHIYDSNGLVKRSRHPESLRILRQRSSYADVVSLSACKNEQEAIETDRGGALRWAFIESVRTLGGTLTYKELLRSVRDYMRRHRFPQLPQLSSSHEIDTGIPFTA